MSLSKKRNDLTLEKKVEVIKFYCKNTGIKQGALAEMFRCGRTQIAMILKHRESILTRYESNASDKRVKLVRYHVHQYMLQLTSTFMNGIPLLVPKVFTKGAHI